MQCAPKCLTPVPARVSEDGGLEHLETANLGFVPINLPFTMPPEEAVGCFKVISPDAVVPYHRGKSDPQLVADMLVNSGIEVRVLALP